MRKAEEIKAAIAAIANHFNIATTDIALIGYAVPSQTWVGRVINGYGQCEHMYGLSYLKNDGSTNLYSIDDNQLEKGGQIYAQKGTPLKLMFPKNKEQEVLLLVWHDIARTEFKVWLMPNLEEWRAEQAAADAQRIADFANYAC